MGEQMHEQQVSRRMDWIRLIIAVIIVIVVLIGIVFAIWEGQERWGNVPVPTIVSVFFAVLSIIFILLRIFYPWTDSIGSARTFTPEKPPPSSGPTRHAGPLKAPLLGYRVAPAVQKLPSTSSTIQKRQKAVEDFYRLLIQKDVTAMVITGMAGVGKSTFAGLLYRYAEEQRLVGKGPFKDEALCMKIGSDDTMIDLAEVLFTALKRPLLNFKDLDPARLAEVLFDALNTAHKTRLVVIDQFDALLDPQTGQIRAGQSGIYEWIDLLNKRRAYSRVVFTSRFWSQKAFSVPTTYLHEYHLRVLENSEGVKLLRRLLQIEGKEEELRLAVEYCEGHPFALRFLGTMLSDYRLSFTAFVKDAQFVKLWLEDVGHILLDSLFTKQLSVAAKRMLEAFSIYREPMPLNAVEAVIDFDDELTKAKVLPTLDILLARSLLSEAGESRYESDESAYRLHPIVAGYIQKHYDDDRMGSKKLLRQTMHSKAADYYLERIARSCPARGSRHSIGDIEPIIESFWHLCETSQYEQAYGLMERESIFSDLNRWYKNSVLLDLYQMLLPFDKWGARPEQRLDIFKKLGVVYSELGQKREAREYFKQALTIVSDTKDRVSILNDLGSVCGALGKKEEALRYLKQGLHIAREEGDRNQEGRILNNLGLVYEEMGEREEALSDLKQALPISQEVRDRREEGKILSNLGLVYVAKGKREEGLGFYDQAKGICEETGDRGAEAVVHTRFGQLYDEMGKKEEARRHFEEALQISREIEDRWEEGKILSYLGHIQIDLKRYDKALNYNGQALRILEQVGNDWEKGRTLRYLGYIYTDLGEHKEAVDYYKQALRVMEEVGDRWGEFKVLNNLAHLYSEFGRMSEANKCLGKASHIGRETRYERREGGLSRHSHRHHDEHRRTKENLERALSRSREHKDRVREGLLLHNLAHVHYEMGNKKEALDRFLDALRLHEETGDRGRVGSTLDHIGSFYFDQSRYEAALFALLLAEMILKEVQSPERERVQKLIDKLHKEVGENRFRAISQQVESWLEEAKLEEQEHPISEVVESFGNVEG